MNSIKKALDKIFIDGLSAMAQGLFATLIIGTIIQQIGNLIPGQVGTLVFLAGKVAASLTGAGIGAALAFRFKRKCACRSVCGNCGDDGCLCRKCISRESACRWSYGICRTGRTAGSVSSSLCGNLFGHIVAGKTKIDILITPIVTIGTGSL